jgi:hypothetical protein
VRHVRSLVLPFVVVGLPVPHAAHEVDKQAKRQTLDAIQGGQLTQDRSRECMKAISRDEPDPRVQPHSNYGNERTLLPSPKPRNATEGVSKKQSTHAAW